MADGTAIVHLIGAGGRGYPDLAKAGLEVPDCSRSTQAGCVMEMRSFAPGRSLRSTSRPRRHYSREGGPGGSHRGARERLEHTCTGVAAKSAPFLLTYWTASLSSCACQRRRRRLASPTWDRLAPPVAD